MPRCIEHRGFDVLWIPLTSMIEPSTNLSKTDVLWTSKMGKIVWSSINHYRSRDNGHWLDGKVIALAVILDLGWARGPTGSQMMSGRVRRGVRVRPREEVVKSGVVKGSVR